jgi:hypothetical protein
MGSFSEVFASERPSSLENEVPKGMRLEDQRMIGNQCFLIWQNGARFRSFILDFFDLAKNQRFLSYVLATNSTNHEIREQEDRQF